MNTDYDPVLYSKAALDLRKRRSKGKHLYVSNFPFFEFFWWKSSFMAHLEVFSGILQLVEAFWGMKKYWLDTFNPVWTTTINGSLLASDLKIAEP